MRLEVAGRTRQGWGLQLEAQTQAERAALLWWHLL